MGPQKPRTASRRERGVCMINDYTRGEREGFMDAVSIRSRTFSLEVTSCCTYIYSKESAVTLHGTRVAS